jgi:iron complex outermembrane receptor protein
MIFGSTQFYLMSFDKQPIKKGFSPTSWFSLLLAIVLITSALTTSHVHASDTRSEDMINEVIVSADFRQTELQETPASISVVDAQTINERGSRHVEDILALVPNLNYSAGASRGRYFQIRGIGERSQFVAPLNPSVGTYVDGIDFTGFGGAATLLDVQQVEILRGSQGTRFGANALAGVVNIKTLEPSAETKAYLKAQMATYNSAGLEAAQGGQLTDTVMYRISIGQTSSDGFIDNTVLGRDNTNNIDEFTSRLKVRWLASDALTIDLSMLLLDIDNGYDAFSLDANRKTMSDQPGHDRQISQALGVNVDWALSNTFSMRSIITTNRTDAEYGYDEDWTDPAFQPGYQAFDNYQRKIARDSAEMRWLSGPAGRIANSDWLIGIYAQQSTIDLIRDYTYSGLFSSQYETESLSLFAEINTDLNERFVITSGLRYENWQSDYADTNQISGGNDENLLGAKLALEYTKNSRNLLYASVTRGYKAGGFNGEINLPDELFRRFDTEYQWNYELGGKFRSPNRQLTHYINLFYTDRKDLQLKSSTPVTNEGGGASYIDFTTNAGQGYSYGIEWEMLWRIANNLNISASLGLLKTKITQHTNPDIDAFNLRGRAAAHAPEFMFSTAIEYELTDSLTAAAEIQGKDKFYYSDSHNYQSQRYNLVNARLTYRKLNYEFVIFANNLLNKEYGVRGFDFGSWDPDPRSGDGFDETQFQQLGTPRVIGLSLRADF